MSNVIELKVMEIEEKSTKKSKTEKAMVYKVICKGTAGEKVTIITQDVPFVDETQIGKIITLSQ